MKYVALSSTPDLFYAPFLPVACALWRQIGYQPLCLLVDPPAWLSSPMQLILSKIGPCRTEFLDRSVTGFKLSTLSQTVRIVAACLLEPDDYLITSDVDMFPLRKEFFDLPDLSKPFTALGINLKDMHFNMCYLVGAVSSWREAFHLTADNLQDALSSLLTNQTDHWGLDEGIVGEMLRKWTRFGEIQLIPRSWKPNETLALDRIDRATWNPASIKEAIDCHSLRPMYEHWEKIVVVLREFLDQKTVQILQGYMGSLKTLIASTTRTESLNDR